jgi:hypothetical protein
MTPLAFELMLRGRRIRVHRRRLLERFERLYVPEPNSGCFLWLGALSPGGYARITIVRSENAHRISWMLFRGNIPDELHVLHHCDVRCCVNPDHLFLGTNDDNIADKVAKGRQARNRGVLHPAAKLTESQVLAILNDVRPLAAIAECYSVTKATITSIKAGTSWVNITNGGVPRRPKPFGEQQGTAKLTEQLVRAIRLDHRSQRMISKAYDISQSSVSRIKSRELWPHVH